MFEQNRFILITTLATLVATGTIYADNTGKVSTITDPSRGIELQLENINGKTKITDMATGAVVEWLEGEQAGQWTNEEYKLMLDKEEVQKHLAQLIQSDNNQQNNASQKTNTSIVSDESRGISIQLENINGQTKITDMSGKEPVFYVDGELAGKLSNADYKKMLDIEAEDKRLHQPVGKSVLATNNALVGIQATYSGIFSMKVAYSTPTCSKPISTKLTASLSNVKLGMNATVSMDLCRDIPLWADTCYGNRSKAMVSTSPNTFSSTWSASFPAGNYYLQLSKTNNGDYANGSFSF